MIRKMTAAVAICVLVAFTSHAGDRNEQRRDRGARHEQHESRRDHARDPRQERHREVRRDDGRGHAWHRDRHDHRDRHRHDGHRYDDRRHVHREPPRYSPRYDHARYVSRDRYRVGIYHRPYGYRPYQWYPGARLPVAYYSPRYVIYDYPAYRLRPPPYGYHWVRVDNDVVLAAIATGVVLQVVNGIFW